MLAWLAMKPLMPVALVLAWVTLGATGCEKKAEPKSKAPEPELGEPLKPSPNEVSSTKIEQMQEEDLGAGLKVTKTKPSAANSEKAASTAAKAVPDDKIGSFTREQIGEGAIKLFENLVSITKANAGNCDKVGDEFKTAIEENLALMKAGREFDKNPANKAWFENKYGGRIKAKMGSMIPTLQACKDNKKLADALKPLSR